MPPASVLRRPLVERAWFEPALLVVLVLLAGVGYAWYAAGGSG